MTKEAVEEVKGLYLKSFVQIIIESTNSNKSFGKANP